MKCLYEVLFMSVGKDILNLYFGVVFLMTTKIFFIAGFQKQNKKKNKRRKKY